MNQQDAKTMFEDAVNEIARRSVSAGGGSVDFESDKFIDEMHDMIYAMLVDAINALEIELSNDAVIVSGDGHTLKNFTKGFILALLKQEAIKCFQLSEAADGRLKMGQ